MADAANNERTQYFVSSYDRINPVVNVNPYSFTAYNKREPTTRNSKVSENYYMFLRWLLLPNLQLQITQTGTAVTGIGTQFNSSMVGGTLSSYDSSTNRYFSDTITAFTSETSITTANSHTIASATDFAIHYRANTANGVERRMYGSISHLSYIILELIFDDEQKTAPRGIISTNTNDGNNLAIKYTTGTIAAGGTGVITGTGTTFTTAMIGGSITSTDSTGVFTDTIITYTSATSITTLNSHTIAAGTSYTITYGNPIPFGSSVLPTYIAAQATNTASFILPIENRTLRPHILLYMYELPVQKCFLRMGGTVRINIRDPTGSIIYIPEIDTNGNALFPLKIINQVSIMCDLLPVNAFDPSRFGPNKYMRGGWTDPSGR